MINSRNKIIKENLSLNTNFLITSILLSIPSIILGEWLILGLPLIILIILSYVYDEKFVIALVLITLFTLVGEFNRSLRIVVQLTDFTLLGYLIVKRYGLSFNNLPSVPKSVLYFLVMYFATMIVSSAVSHYPFAGVKTIVMQFIFFIIVYVFYSLINNESDVRNYFLSILIVACILVTVAFISFILEGYSLLNIISQGRARIAALMNNYEAFTNFFVIAFPIVVGNLLLNSKTKKNKINWFLLICFSLGLALNMSRSAILGIVVSTAIVFFMLRRKSFYKFIISLFVIILIFILYEPLNQMISILLRIEEGMSARDYLWTMSINIIKDYPIFGLGPGAFKYEIFNYYPFMLNDYYGRVFIYFNEVSEGVNLAHNIFLVFFSDMGIIGFITILTLPVIYFRIGYKTIRKYKHHSSKTYYLIISLFAAGTSVIVRNLFNSIGLLYIGGIHTDLPFWLIFSSLVYFYMAPITNDIISEKKRE